ncbi:beta-mannosidase-like [Physella acuta]|uniref:beta-mannosidase-like n=1 Tax=Physella acuta TaxID=109671 RepID=UPI0027DE3E70|nr:beta-mannosidase-like [Physella acuta]
MLFKLLLLKVLYFVVQVQSLLKLDLGGNWTVFDTSSGLKVLGEVPGSMYTALLKQGVIQDPLWRDNDVALAWLGLANWTYSRTFTVSNDVATSNRKLLVSEGLDTIATVFVNNKLVGQSDNMFVKSVFDLTNVLQSGDNSITIQFSSAVREAGYRANHSSYVIPPECPPAVQNGQCHVNQVRKEQCSFSWDWGPSFPTQGVWKPIYIIAYIQVSMLDATAVVNKVNSQWQVVGEVLLGVAPGPEVQGHLTAAIPGLNLTYSQDVVMSSTNSTLRFTIDVPETKQVSLWWPNGYGDQVLYDVDVVLTTALDKSQKSLRVGFRTVELVQDPVSSNLQDGLTFYFRINDIPVFLKGSNWIPADSFQERVTEPRLEYLLQSAASVHINAMRVWGGGVYESDEFYQLCDLLGIMIWQDFMFSVALYPTYQSFLNSVATEVRQQVRRLKSHPSVIVWAGNNENEKGLRQNWFNTEKNFTLYYNDYIDLYVKTIKPFVNEEDPSREYLTSSPSNGKESVQEGYVALDPDSERYGDIHFYDYILDQWMWQGFRVPRMASEYGIQAWCNNETLAKVLLPSDFVLDSDMVKHRQHHAMGNEEMGAEIGAHLKLPTSLDEQKKMSDFIYLSQINQAMSIRTQTEHYRRHQSQLLSDGRGLTMGALYWQLNDIWQAPTWASIGYDGSWKMLHYFAKSFFAKHLISPYYLDDDTLDVYIVIDELPVQDARDPLSGALYFKPIMDQKDFSGINVPVQESNRIIQNALRMTTGNLKIDLYQYTSFQSLHSWSVNYNLKTTAESVFTKKVSDIISESGCPAKQKCILTLTATDTSGVQKSSSWFALTYPKDSVLPPANVKISTVVKLGNNTFEIEVTSDVIALYVWISSDVLGLFSDNGFPMFTSTVKVMFKSVDDVSLPQLMSRLRVRSITDVKNSDSFVVG